MTTRALVYARQSLDRTGEALAVTRQLEDCRALAERLGWEVVGEHVDNDTSATTGRRPQYEAMLERLRAGQAGGIVAYAPDRLARRPRDLEDVLDLAERHGVRLATVAGDVDLSSPWGRAVARVFGAIARQEVEQKGARQKRANLQRAQAGRVGWTRRPFGYDRDPGGGILLVDAEARELHTAAAAVLDGASLASVVADLNRRGVPTSTGGRWTVTALRRLLVNPRHAGRAVYRGQDVSAGDWPAVLTEDQHRALVARLTDPTRRTQTGTAHRYLLSGLVRCGLCGEPMFATPMGQRGGYWMAYRCRATHLARRLEPVDELVEGVVLARLARPDAAALLVPDGEGADELRVEAVQLRERLDELASLLAEGVLTAAGVRASSERLRARLREVEQRQDALTVDPALSALVTADDVRATWDALPLRKRRAVVDLLLVATILPAGKGVRFAPEQVRIDWRTS